jgi:hypothetical protein
VRKFSKRKVAATIAISVILIGGGGAAAFGYWSAGGSGTGTGTAGTNSTLSVTQTSTIAGLAPSSAPQTLSGTIANTNSSKAYVTSITASISSVSKATGAPAGTCSASDFTLTGATVTVNAEIPANSTTTTWTGPTVAFNDLPTTNQDACKGATVNFAYAIS